MSKMNDLDVCKSLLTIIDEMYEADGITPIMPAPDPREEKVDEAMSDAYGVVNAKSEQIEGSVEFKQHKNTDKGSVTIEASGDDMQALADVLKLAGLTLPKEINPNGGEEVEIEPDAEPEEDVIISKDDDNSCDCSDCGQDPCVCGDPDDAERQQTKQTLVNIIKDKLQQRLK